MSVATQPVVQAPKAPARPLLEVRDLKVHFPLSGGWGGWLGEKPNYIRAVDGISFSIAPGETLGLVGESGCGKSTTARAIVNLVPITAGEIYLDGERISGLSDGAMLPYRSRVQ